MQNSAYGFLFLAPLGLGDILAIIFGVLFAAAAVFAVIKFISFKNYKKNIGSLEDVKTKLIAEATEESKTLKKEAILEAKEQEIKLRNELEKETRENPVF